MKRKLTKDPTNRAKTRNKQDDLLSCSAKIIYYRQGGATAIYIHHEGGSS